MRLTIIVTVYNEVRTVKQAIDDVRSLDIEKEIFVIDNCSTDGTQEVLKELDDDDITIIYQDKNYGYGKSIETGISLANGEYVFVQHADLEYDYTKCLDMLQLAEKHRYDAVLASRLKDTVETRSKWSLIRERPAYLAALISTYLVNEWYGHHFTDVIGTKLYRTSSLRRIPIDTHGPGFEFEHVSRMCQAGFKIGEINIGYKPRAISKEKKMKPYHMLNALWALFRVRFLES